MIQKEAVLQATSWLSDLKKTYFDHNNQGDFSFSMLQIVRACLHEGGGPQIGEVTCGGLPHLKCKDDHIKMRDYILYITRDLWIRLYQSVEGSKEALETCVYLPSILECCGLPCFCKKQSKYTGMLAEVTTFQ